MTTWLEDSNGNKCSVEYFGSKEVAQKALESLVRCFNCTNCSDCRGCSGCSDCRGCRGCSDCSGCSGCSDCSGCSGCSDCRGCSGCSDCRGCRGCSDCSGCSGCSDCSGCSGCSDCCGCSGCSGCRGCCGCSGCSDKINLVGFVGAIKPSSKIPVIQDIHQKILEATSKLDAFDMSAWHTCETTHCRAGWVVILAGDAGKALELFHRSTCLAAQLIYRESSPIKVSVNSFFVNNVDAMADIKRCAELEKAA